MKRVLFPILALALAASFALPLAAPVTATAQECSISGYKYLGDPETGECTGVGLEGWTINLTGPVSATTTTDSDGYYEFTALPDGSYTVSETLRDGWTNCTPASYEITIETIDGNCQIHRTGVVVSDTNTLVTSGNVPGAQYSYNAVYAWPHPAWAPAKNTFSNGADWIWESYLVVPGGNETVGFQRSFYIPGTPTGGTVRITADNICTVTLNGTLIGRVLS